MAKPLHALRVNAVELLRQPGAVQPIVQLIDPEPLDVIDERVVGAVEIDLTATSTIDGIVVAGTVGVPYQSECRRCAKPLTGTASAMVDELYQFEVSDDEAYLIDGALIDLSPVIRQYALLEVPADLLCRDDCAGLCPSCGIDLNVDSCTCDTTVTDPRWAALDQLKAEFDE